VWTQKSKTASSRRRLQTHHEPDRRILYWVARPGAGRYWVALLVSSEGRPVNKQVLDMVAEPVEITGDVLRQGELSILRADPSTYKRIGR